MFGLQSSSLNREIFLDMKAVQIDGVDDLKAALEAIGRDAPKALRNAARQVARHTAQLAKAEAPVKTGALRKSIGARETQKGVYYAGVRRGVFGRGRRGGKKIPAAYAYIVEKKRKFFSNALERARAEAVARYVQAIRDFIAKTLSKRR